MSSFQKGFRDFGAFRRRQQHIPWGATVAAPITVPPFDTGNNVWAFDPDGVGAAQYVAGPTGTVTTPVKTQSSPSYYTYGSTDYVDFGNSLESTWDTAGGFTVYICFQATAGDIARANAPLTGKYATATNAEWAMILNAGVIDFYVQYSTGYFGNYDVGHSGTLVAGTNYVIACTFDKTLATGSRNIVYVNGTASGVAGAFVGADNPVTASTAPLRIGEQSGGTIAPVSKVSYTYAYKVAHSAGTVASITSWLQNTKGWK